MDRKFKSLKLTFLIIAITIIFTGCEIDGNLFILSLFKNSEASTISELSDQRFDGTFTRTYEGLNYNWCTGNNDYYKVVEETYTFDGSNKVKYKINKRLYVINEGKGSNNFTENHYAHTVNSTRYLEFQVNDDYDEYRVRLWDDFCKPADFCDWLKYEFYDNNATLHLYITDDDNPDFTNYNEFTKVIN
jgi:hypothetical protein